MTAVWLCAGRALTQSVDAAPVKVSSSASPVSPNGLPDAAAAPSVSDPSAYRSALSRYEGLTVHDIQFRGGGFEDPARARSLLAQRENEPLEKVKVQKSIQALYETGRFANLEVEAQRTPDAQVSLVFVGNENYFVGARRIEGQIEPPPIENQLVNATRLQLGGRS